MFTRAIDGSWAGAGGGGAPARPTLVIVPKDDGTGYIATLSDCTPGQVYYLEHVRAGTDIIVAAGARVGDGNIDVICDAGHYYAHAFGKTEFGTYGRPSAIKSVTVATKTFLHFVELIADYLESLGIATTGVDMYVCTLPETPQKCTAIIPSGGPTLRGEPTKYPAVQILHRNPSREDGMRVTLQISNALNNVWNVLANYPGRFVLQSEPGASFQDPNNHSVFPLNFTFTTVKQN